MKKLLLGLFITFLFTLLVSHASAQTPTPESTGRYATSDQCGFYVTSQNPAEWLTPPPSNWNQCRACLYPNASTNPQSGDTLRIDEGTNLPPTPKPGRIYGILGCFSTKLDDFTQKGAATSLVQLLLNLIFYSSGGIALLYFMYGSFLIMTSQADPERLNYGKRILLGSLIGIIFVLSAVFIVQLIANSILRIPGFGGGVTPTPTP